MLVAARTGTVEHHLNLNVVASWPSGHQALGRANGVVTTIDIKSGALVSPGQRLFSVDLRPVFLARGSVPMFRDLQQGDKGADVAQLEDLLVSQGLLSTADTTFDSSTAAAVRTFQQRQGMVGDGVVRAGDLVFTAMGQVASIRLDSSIEVGASVSSGQPVLTILGRVPRFTLPVADEQAATIGADTLVVIDNGQGQEWRARTDAGTTNSEQASVTFGLEPTGPRPICRQECDTIGVRGETTLPARIVLQESVDGITVPTSSLTTSADGTIAVVMASGRRAPVEVRAQANGLAVIEGIDEGTNVRTPAESAS